MHAIDLGIHDPVRRRADDGRLSPGHPGKNCAGAQVATRGKGTDGEVFFAEMYAELDELERQGRE